MKLKKIAKICTSEERLYLYDIPSMREIKQWVGTNKALYPLEGIPYLEKDSLMNVFDIPEKKRKNMYFDQAEMPFEIEHNTDDEIRLNREVLTMIDDMGRELKFIPSSRGGMIVLNSKYLSPLNEEFASYYERITPQGRIYIAVKVGMLLQAIIFPNDIIDGKFVQKLTDITDQCTRALREKGKMINGQLCFDGNGEIIEGETEQTE